MLALMFATPVAAQPSEADAAFKRARDLFKAGKYVQACSEFERSQQLDPQLGTQFNLAQCDEKIGKLATAHALYRLVASKDTKPDRRKFAADLAAKLAPRVPKLVIDIAGPANPPGLVVRLDGNKISPGRPLAVDVRSYELTVKADGKRDISTTVRITEEGKTITVVVPLVGSGDAEVTQHSEPTDAGAGSGSGRRTAGKVMVAAGGASLIAGGVFGLVAMRNWDDAKNVCGGMTCTTQADADRANDLRDRALGRATISNVLFVAGGVLATAGLVVWLTAPDQGEVALSANATSSGASVVLSGSF